jgi:protein-disulfide isomerase
MSETDMRSKSSGATFTLGLRAPDLVTPVSAADHHRGARRPVVTIVEYADFASQACRVAEPGVKMVLAAHPEAVQLVFRHLPIEVAHPLALMAAEAADAAAAQGQFWQMHDTLLEEGASSHRPALDRAAETLGLDTSQFKATLDDGIYLQRIREQQEQGARNHLRASPEFFVNGQLCDVSNGIHELANRVASRR